MRTVYRVLALLIAVGVMVQAASVAYGWFAVLSDLDKGGILDKNFKENAGQMIHSIVGEMVIPIIALLLLIVSFFAKVPGGLKWAGIVFGVTVVQVALAYLAFGVPALGALHGINALALMAVAGLAGRKAAGRDEATAGPVPADAPAERHA
jgi:hypothetical protein